MRRWSSAHLLHVRSLSGGVAALATTLATTVASAQQFQDQTASRFPADPLEYTNQISVGDLNGDGHLDIVFANGAGFSTASPPQQLRILINNGAGNFADESLTRLPVPSLFIARGVELGDVNGDGALDIVLAQDFNRQPQLFINNGAGVFTNETAARLPVITLSSARAQFADVDNDGDLDIYLVNGGAINRFGTARGVLLINNGSGVFADETAARTPAENVIEPMDCIFGDLDGNFTLDLVIASRRSTAATTNAKRYMNNGSGVFTAAGMPSTRVNYSFDMGDIDGDGDLDLIGANAHNINTNSELLARNNGAGTFASITFPALNNDDNDSKFFDYDNDGDLDLIIAAISNGVERIYLNDGNGGFTLQAGVITAVNDASMDVEVADFTGDGRLDIVTAQGESGVFTNRIYINVTGPADTIPPTIVRTEQIQNALAAAGPFHVRTVVYDGMTSDRGFHNRGITLNYSVKGQGAPTQVPMKWVGNSMWRGTIPVLPNGSVVSYFVTATDFAGNVGTGETKQFEILWPPCPQDINSDHVVGVPDLLAVISGWGTINPVVHDVQTVNETFQPNVINAKSGDSVLWTWVSGGTHSVTSGTNCTSDGRFNSILSSGTFQYDIPLNFSGVIPYFCLPHCLNGMTGTINVADIPADINNDGTVGVPDLLSVISAWGPCPQN